MLSLSRFCYPKIESHERKLKTSSSCDPQNMSNEVTNNLIFIPLSVSDDVKSKV